MNDKILVLGVGDVARCGSSAGFQAVRRMLSSVAWPMDVDVVQRPDGVGALQPEWQDYGHIVVVAAVADRSHAPWTVHVSRVRQNADGTSSGIVSPWLRRLVNALARAPRGPEVFLVLVTVREPMLGELHFSRAVASFIPQVQMLLRGLVGMLTRQQECVYY